MNIFSLCGFVILSSVLCIVLRKYSGNAALGVGALASVCVAIFAVGSSKEISDFILGESLSKIIGMKTVFKILGISYFCSLASDIAERAGEPILSKNLELAGKCVILSMCLPMIKELIAQIGALSV